MRFQWYPLDNQICKFRIGSFAYDVNKMRFTTKRLTYDATAYNTILDYSVEILPLDEKEIFILRDGNKVSISQTFYDHLFRFSYKSALREALLLTSSKQKKFISRNLKFMFTANYLA